MTVDDINKLPKDKASRVEYGTLAFDYTPLWTSPSKNVQTLIFEVTQLDAAILVVSAVEDFTLQTDQHVRLAREAGVPSVIPFISKCDRVDDSADRASGEG